MITNNTTELPEQMHTYLHFPTFEEARTALDILHQEAAQNDKFLSYNRFQKIVYDKDTTYPPTYGWTLFTLNASALCQHHRFVILDIPCCDRY